jgi:hypothetical protein
MNTTTLPENTFPVSIDVVGLYSNIPNEEGLECFKEALDTRKEKTVPTNLLVTLLRLVLIWNIFEFDKNMFLQLTGTAMGTRAAPTFPNIFMAKIDKMVLAGNETLISFFRRFIDDIFMLWLGTEEQFLTFMDNINSLHPTIKFTHNYNLREKSTVFLDTKITIKKW